MEKFYRHDVSSPGVTCINTLNMLRNYDMQLGINENIPYKGETYHIQTEDGGEKNPVITTLVFKGGTILASKRTNYADILKSDKLDMVVRDLMAEQHSSLIKAVKEGRFDKGPETAVKTEKVREEPEEKTRREEAAAEKSSAPPVDEKSLEDFVLDSLSLNK